MFPMKIKAAGRKDDKDYFKTSLSLARPAISISDQLSRPDSAVKDKLFAFGGVQ
jgi:hypothetical protein